MSVLKVKNGDQWDIVPAIKGDTGDPAADESITDAMLVPDGIKTEIDWLWGNQLTDIREGELLQTDDAYEAPLVSLDVDGESTQVVTTGKNLFDKNTAYAGWYINSSGIRANGLTNSCTDFIPIVGGNAYAFSYGAALAAGNYIAWYTDADQSTVTGNRVDARNLQNIVATSPSDANYVRFSFQTSSLGKIQLEAGSSATAYEPYTGGKPSPSPDYPQSIVSVDEPSLLIEGSKNLIDWAHPFKTGSYHYDIALGTVVTPSTSANVEVSMEGDTLVSVVKAGWNGAVWRSPNLPNGTYHMYFQKTETSDATGTAVGSTLFVVDKSNKCVRKVGNHATSGDWNTTITLSGDEAAICVCAGTRSGTYGTYSYAMPQLELGSIATSYEPYAGNTVPLLPDGYSLRSLPNGTKDELHLSYLRPSTREGWAWYNRELVQRIGYTHITSANYYGTINSKPYARCDFDGGKEYVNSEDSNCYSDKFTNWSYLGAPWVTRQYSIKSVRKGTALESARFMAAFIVLDHTQTNLDDFNTAIAAMGGFDAQYELQSYTTTQLDPIELPIMPSKDTTIWSDPSAQLKMTYIQDTNLVIESLEATVADMATS